MELNQRAQNILPSPTLVIDARAKRMILEGMNVINFGAGEPDFDTPEYIKKAAVEALEQGITKYTPVDGIKPLKEAIVDKFKKDDNVDYSVDEIIVSAGAKHSLYNAFMVLCQRGDEVILPAPYWVSYHEQIKLAGATPVIIFTSQKNGFKLTPEQLRSAITPRTKAIILNTPSNPTGAVYTSHELAALAEILLENKIYIIFDEIYEKLIYDNHVHVNIVSLSPELKELSIIINGVSKSYAMTGWRIGYAAAPLDIARAMCDFQSHSTSNPTSIAQVGAMAAITGPQEQILEMHKHFALRRKYMVERLQAMPGLYCNVPGGAFYVFPNIEGLFNKSYKGKVIKSGSDFASLALTEVQVCLVPGVAFGDDRYFRLSYATSMEDIVEGLNRIEFLINKLEH